MAEVAKVTGIPPTTTYRLLRELERGGILERSAGGMYQPGRQLRLIGAAPPLRSAISRHGAQVMADLAAGTDADPALAVLDQMDVLSLRIRSRPPLALTAPGSATVPAHATAVGKVLLAFATPAVMNAVLGRKLTRFTPYTITDPRELRRVLAVTRVSMIATGRREFDLKTVDLATPVFDGDGGVVAALGLSLIGRPCEIDSLRPALLVAARKLSDMLRNPGHSYGQVVALPDRQGPRSAVPMGPARIARA